MSRLSPELSGRSYLNPTDLDNLLYSPSLSFAKQLQGEIALGIVSSGNKNIEINTFGGVVIKTVPVSRLQDQDKQLIPPEYVQRLETDTHFYRMHFLPMGNVSSKDPGEALKMLMLGVADLADLATWLRQQRSSDPQKLANRFMLGFSAYGLGHSIRKHLPLFEVLAESRPLDKRIPLERVLMFSETAFAHMNGGGTAWVLLGNFVNSFLLESAKLPRYQQRLLRIIRERYPEYKGQTAPQIETKLRQQAILRATGIKR